MNSGIFLDSQGNYDGRDRHDVLTDYRFHQLLDEELSQDHHIDEALEDGDLENILRDDRLYFVDKDYYHTKRNIDLSNFRKLGGDAGDLDVGYIDIPSGKITKIELKSPGVIPPLEVRNEREETFDPINHAEEQNQYLKKLLDNIENSRQIEIPYSSRVEAWNDVVRGQIESVDDIPQYSDIGNYVCTSKAKAAAEESEVVEALNQDLFNGWMLGGGEDILENMEIK